MLDAAVADNPARDADATRAYMHRLCATVERLAKDALDCVPRGRAEDIAEGWLRRAAVPESGEAAAATFVNAVMFAIELVLFARSGSGTTAIDRLARRHRPTDPDEALVMQALRATRFQIMRIAELDCDGFVWLSDLVSNERLRVFADGVDAACLGTAVALRVVPISDDVFLPLRQLTPLDHAALDIALSFVHDDSRLANPERCAETIYRRIVQHGTLLVPGLNLAPSGSDADGAEDEDELPFGPEDGEVHALAFAWAELADDATPDPADDQTVRELTGPASFVEALFCALVSREAKQDRIAQAYTRICVLMIETVQRRAAAGMTRLTLANIAAMIDQAIAAGELPASIRSMFDDLCGRARVAAPGSARSDSETDRLIGRIRALRAKTVAQGCTEAEALAAAEKVAELLDRHGMSLGEIDYKEQSCEGLGIDTTRRRLAPLDECVPAIAAFFDCRTWIERIGNTTGPFRHIFFGVRTDVEAAHYLYDLVEQAFETETKAFTKGKFYASLKRGERRGGTNSFQLGLAQGIRGKLETLRQQRESALRASSGRDLVPIKAGLVDDELAHLGLSLRMQRRGGNRRVLSDAYQAGHEAGERFEIHPGLRDQRHAEERG